MADREDDREESPEAPLSLVDIQRLVADSVGAALQANGQTGATGGRRESGTATSCLTATSEAGTSALRPARVSHRSARFCWTVHPCTSLCSEGGGEPFPLLARELLFSFLPLPLSQTWAWG